MSRTITAISFRLIRYCITSRALLLSMLWLSATASAFAGELKVLDSRGLIRGLKEIRGTATVVVEVGSPLDGRPMLLSNVNGLAPDIGGRTLTPRSVEFENVPEGEWKIQSNTGVVPVQNVLIK